MDLFTELQGFKFVTTLFFKKIHDDKTLCNTFYSISKAEKVINESGIDYVFETIYSTILSNTQKSLGKLSGLLIDSVTNYNNNISMYNPLACSNYIKLPKEPTIQEKV